jgi:hypothetical protein
MKTEILKERENDKNLCDAIAKGALLWAPLYSVCTAAVSYALLDGTADETVSYTELLMRSLLVLSPFCILAGVSTWTVSNWIPIKRRLSNRKEALPKLPHFVPPAEAERMKHSHA